MKFFAGPRVDKDAVYFYRLERFTGRILRSGLHRRMTILRENCGSKVETWLTGAPIF